MSSLYLLIQPCELGTFNLVFGGAGGQVSAGNRSASCCVGIVPAMSGNASLKAMVASSDILAWIIAPYSPARSHCVMTLNLNSSVGIAMIAAIQEHRRVAKTETRGKKQRCLCKLIAAQNHPQPVFLERLCVSEALRRTAKHCLLPVFVGSWKYSKKRRLSVGFVLY